MVRSIESLKEENERLSCQLSSIQIEKERLELDFDRILKQASEFDSITFNQLNLKILFLHAILIKVKKIVNLVRIFENFKIFNINFSKI